RVLCERSGACCFHHCCAYTCTYAPSAEPGPAPIRRRPRRAIARRSACSLAHRRSLPRSNADRSDATSPGRVVARFLVPTSVAAPAATHQQSCRCQRESASVTPHVTPRQQNAASSPPLRASPALVPQSAASSPSPPSSSSLRLLCLLGRLYHQCGS